MKDFLAVIGFATLAFIVLTVVAIASETVDAWKRSKRETKARIERRIVESAK